MTGETVYLNGQPIENVLVHIGEFERGDYRSTEISKPIGDNADFTLYFPMDFTGNLDGQKLTVRGLECEVLGHTDHERQKQVFGRWLGQWDMVVRVRKTLTDFAETIKVVRTLVSRNVLGDRTSVSTTLYLGRGQARKSQGVEATGETGTRETETWYFVVPWNDAYATMPTQQLTVQYNERIYDVREIQDLGWKHEYASIQAVWHE